MKIEDKNKKEENKINQNNKIIEKSESESQLSNYVQNIKPCICSKTNCL